MRGLSLELQRYRGHHPLGNTTPLLSPGRFSAAREIKYQGTETGCSKGTIMVGGESRYVVEESFTLNPGWEDFGQWAKVSQVGEGQFAQASRITRSLTGRTLSLVRSLARHLRALPHGQGTGGRAWPASHPASLKSRVLVPAPLLSSCVT